MTQNTTHTELYQKLEKYKQNYIEKYGQFIDVRDHVGIYDNKITIYDNDIVVDRKSTERYRLDIWSIEKNAPAFCKDGRVLHLQHSDEEAGRNYCKLENNKWVQLYDSDADYDDWDYLHAHTPKKDMKGKPIAKEEMMKKIEEYFTKRYGSAQVIMTNLPHP